MMLFKQSIVSTFRQLRVERFRTLLSLTGVSVGIFSIVAVLTVVDSMKGVIIDSFSSFGSDIVMIEQIPLEPDLNEDGFFKWWEYAARKQVDIDEYQKLKDDDAIGGIAFCNYLTGIASFGNKTYKEGEIVGVEGDWDMAIQGAIEDGRGFTDLEIKDGDAVTVIGNDVALSLFDSVESSIGNKIFIAGKQFRIIGVFDKMGSSDMSLTDIDAVKLIPYRACLNLDNSGSRRSIIVSPSSGWDKDEFVSYLGFRMRNIRGLSTDSKDDFALNRVAFLEDEVSEIFRLVNIVGWLVGCFSLLIGGFGIANIMFVAVEERIPQIGIMKALGAKRVVIMMQFVVEAALLSIIGAVVGILLVALGVMICNQFVWSDIPGGFLQLSGLNIAKGLLVALVIGLISGVAPARKAALLQPSVAISSIK